MAEHPLVLQRGPVKVASSAAVTAAVGAVACGICCVLPLAIPAVALASTGGVIAWFGQAFWGALYVAVGLVGVAWAWVAVESLRSRRRPAPSTIRVMLVATVVLAVALIWPALEPHIIRALRS